MPFDIIFDNYLQQNGHYAATHKPKYRKPTVIIVNKFRRMFFYPQVLHYLCIIILRTMLLEVLHTSPRQWKHDAGRSITTVLPVNGKASYSKKGFYKQ